MELEETKRAIEEYVKLAERKVKEEGGTFERWLWYLLMPPVFFHNKDRIRIEYWSNDGSVIWRFTIDKKTRKITKAEEIEEDPYDR